jgi:RHS repeat-associated protein
LHSTIGRLSSLSDSTGTLESYSYLGLGTVVIRSHPQPTIDLTYVKQSGESNGAAGDEYTGLDRFGRIIDQRWINTSTSTATDRFQYTYDRDGNVLEKDNLVDSSFDEAFTYDGLNQLSTYALGSSHTQDFNYDSLGNFDSVTTDGGTPQSRSANDQNEITSISGATTPAYDADGNMTGDQTGLTFVYDAWNRMVKVMSGSTVLETFSCDGRDYRMTNTISGATTDLYYSPQEQLLEEQVSGADADRYVWSPVYVNAMVLRDRAITTPGTLDQRLWGQQDANWNTTTLIDGSGAAQERYAYDPYGLATIYDGSYAVQSGGSNNAWIYLYQGMRYDLITGLYAANERWYSPSLGTWTSLDPLAFYAGDPNLYKSFLGNPINRTDSTGLLTEGYLSLGDFFSGFVVEYDLFMATNGETQQFANSPLISLLASLNAAGRSELGKLLSALSKKANAKLVISINQGIRKGPDCKCCQFDPLSKPEVSLEGLGIETEGDKFSLTITIPGTNKEIGIDLKFKLRTSIEHNCKDDGKGGDDELKFRVTATLSLHGFLKDRNITFKGKQLYSLTCGTNGGKVGVVITNILDRPIRP